MALKPSELIDKRIADVADWRGEMLARLRKVIHDADPEIVEEWKWMGGPVWSHDGIIQSCRGQGESSALNGSFR